MQDLLTIAATTTLYGTVGFVVFGYVAYVWQRTAPVAATPSEFLTAEELLEEGNAVELAAQVDVAMSTPLPVESVPASLPELFATVDEIMSKPVYNNVPATVKRRRKVSSTPVQEVIAPCPKPKRGRPRKVA